MREKEEEKDLGGNSKASGLSNRRQVIKQLNMITGPGFVGVFGSWASLSRHILRVIDVGEIAEI